MEVGKFLCSIIGWERAIGVQAEKCFCELDQIGAGLAGAEFVEGRGNWGNIERRTAAREDARATGVWTFDNCSLALCVVLHAMRLPVRGGHSLSNAFYFETFASN
jgi:hypothetical protein